MEDNFELYRKYRPTSFDEIVGNESVIESLKKEIENGTHTFLFIGPPGCGKTTLARIVAKEVNASEFSTFEINSANNRGIDTAREIMDNMRFYTADGGSMIYILDEVHMITQAGQNAFLKALEDTPSHCYFFLCTTDPQKLIPALKSRCSVVNVKPLDCEQMTYLIKRTARAEHRKITQEIIDKIYEISQGGCRTALKLLAKVLYLDDDDKKIELLNSISLESSVDSIALCRALAKNRPLKEILQTLKDIDVSDAERIRQGVMGYMNSIIMKGGESIEAINAIQAFSSADTFKNGKFAITVAILDFCDLMSN